MGQYSDHPIEYTVLNAVAETVAACNKLNKVWGKGDVIHKTIHLGAFGCVLC